MSIRPLLLAVCASLVLVTPASAVVGGEKIAYSDTPWFASVASCGGTLVAPDRVLTAAHCFNGSPAETVGWATVSDQTVKVSNIALAPGFDVRNGENYLNDVAIVQLAQPIVGVVPAALGGVDVAEARIIGNGRQFAPNTGHSEAEMLEPSGLHQATLRSLSDAGCARAFKGYRAAAGEHFDAARMRCSIDSDGKAPLSSGCNGDSGGPLVTGLNSSPVVLGVVSWGGDRCGADHLPSVFMDVNRYRSFIADPSPTWAPTKQMPVKVTGKRRHTCTVDGARERGTHVRYVWKHLPRWGQPTEVARGRHYTPAKKGESVGCFVYASNDGGEILVGSTSVNHR
jgi:secreted trypsin-like serine protease